MYTEKLPPHDIDAEEAVLGSLLIDPEAIIKVIVLLRPDDFFREANRWVFAACNALYERNIAINQITAAEELERAGKLEAVGTAAYLSHLVSIVPTTVHVEFYARIVNRLSLMRKLITSAGQIAAIGYEAGPDVDLSLDRAEDILFRLRHGQSPRDFVHIRTILDQYFDENATRTKTTDGRLQSIPTGFESMDTLLGGLQRSDMVVLAARPSLGKSSLALNMARNAAVDHGARVAVFSLEMSKEQLVQRLLSAEAEVDSKRIRQDIRTPEEQNRLIQAMGRLAEAPIYIDDSPLLSVVEMRSKARRLNNEQALDLIIVDYLQLIRGASFSENRVQEVSEISRSLKTLARELSVPLIAVSQLSRAVDTRVPHTPVLSDLRESGSIEQDADIVMFIYRDDYYFKEEEWEKQHPDEPYPAGKAQIIVAKHRNGPVGTCTLRFRSNLATFVNPEGAEEGYDASVQRLLR